MPHQKWGACQKWCIVQRYVGKTKDYSITNLMVADIPVKYGEYEIKNMMFVAPVVSYGKRIISVVTCNGRMVITRHEMREC